MRDRQLDSIFNAMGPTNEKSAFILALMILQSPDPDAYMKTINSAIEKLYNPSGNGDNSPESTYFQMDSMYKQARSIYMMIKEV